MLLFIPTNKLTLFLEKVKNKDNKSQKDNLKISTSINKKMQEKLIASKISSISKKSINSNEIEAKLLTNIDTNSLTENPLSGETIGSVRIVDDFSNITFTFSMIEKYNTSGEGGIYYNLIYNNKLCGRAEDWYDDINQIPNSLKNNDNVVLNPEDNQPILSFIIDSNTHLPKNTYREYQYLEDLGNLQNTNIVAVDYY